MTRIPRFTRQLLGAVALGALVASPSLAQEATDDETVGAGANRALSASGKTSSAQVLGADVEVTPDGALATRIDIEVPPGRNGLTPQLGLRYDSNAGIGLGGLGWQLAGFPAVVRVPHDRGVRHDGNDVFAFSGGGLEGATGPGQRLVPATGATGFFHTAEESWGRFRPAGTCGSGPCTWTLLQPDGSSMSFGGRPGTSATTSRLWERNAGRGGSGGVEAFAVEEMRDLHGNRIRFAYEADGWMLYPRRVTYGCLPGEGDDCTGVREVELVYSTRSDGAARPRKLGRRLDRIVVRSDGALVRELRLEYEVSPASDRQRLIRVRSFGADGTTEAPPRTYGYSAATPLARVMVWRPGVTGNEGTQALSGDVDGDGYDDVVRASLDGTRARIEVARGSATGLGDFAMLTRDGSYDRWQALLADVDGDGRDDLVLWTGWPVAHVQVAQGRAGGLAWPPAAYAYDGALDAIRAGTTSAAHQFRMLPADVDGDQHTDLVMVNKVQARIAWLRGTPTGLAAPVHQPSAGYPEAFRIEPTVIDLDGDGDGDTVLPYSAVAADGTGLAMLVFEGGPAGPSAARTLRWTGATSTLTGISPYQLLAGDANGDQRGDLLLGYTGIRHQLPSGPWTKPYRRDVRSFLGLTLPASWTATTASYRALITDVDPPASVPYPYLRSAREAFWQHHGGDVNGDGLTDVVMYYGGADGQLVHVALASSAGTGASGTATASAAAALTTALPDGGRNVHKYQSRVVDLDDDGYDDLVWYYAGALGTKVHVLYGSPTGLTGAVDRVIESTSLVTPEHGTESHGELASSVALLTADVNGDGKLDLLLSTHQGVRYVMSQGGRADRLISVQNGVGGRIDVEYTPSARLAGAVDPAASCSSRAVCGIPDRTAAYLVTRVTGQSGRGMVSRASYEYKNRRVLTGAVARRAHLGFAQMILRDALDKSETWTTYRQDYPLHGRTSYLWRYEWTGLGTVVAGYGRTTWEHVTTRFGTSWVRGTADDDWAYEEGVVSLHQRATRSYGEYGEVTSASSCVGGQCLDTLYTYQPADEARWIVQRQRGVRLGRRDTNQLLDANEMVWTGDVVRERRRLLCDLPENCRCLDDLTRCTSGGANATGRWVTVESGLVYDRYGQVTQSTDARGLVTLTTYDPLFRAHEASVTRHVPAFDGAPAIDLVLGWSYDRAGNRLRFTDERGQVTTHTYDALGREVAVDRPGGGGERWRFVGLGDANLQHVEHQVVTGRSRLPCPSGGGGGGSPFTPLPGGSLPGGTLPCLSLLVEDTLWDREYFDGAGRWHRREEAGAEGTVQVRRIDSWVASKRVSKVSSAHLASAPSEAIWHETTLDGRGRPVQLRRLGSDAATVLGSLSRTTYQARQTITQRNTALLDDGGAVVGAELWREKRERFTTHGDLEVIVDESGNETLFTYDAFWRQESIVGPAPAGVSTLPAVTPIYAVDYDGWGRITRDDDSVRGYSDRVWSTAGDLLEISDARGLRLRYSYDALGRQRRKTLVEDGVETPLSTNRYDEADVVNGRGRLTTSSDDDAAQRVLAYDADGRISLRRVTLAGLPGSYQEGYTHDLAGRLRRVSLPDGSVIDYGYHAGGALETVTAPGVSARFSRFDAQGLAGSRQLGDGVSQLVIYRPDGLLGHVRTYDSDNFFTAYQVNNFTYDAAGNVRAIDEVDLGRRWSYGYDAQERLTSAMLSLPGTTFPDVWAFAYDAAGNITRRGAVDRIDYEPQLVRGRRGATISYEALFDEAGNLTQKASGASTTLYDYDHANLLTEVRREGGATVAEMAYGPDDRRVRQVSYVPGGTVTTWYVTGYYQVRESSLDAGEFVATRVISAPTYGIIALATTDALLGVTAPPVDGGVALMSGGTLFGLPEGVYYHVHDHLGSTALVTNAAGEPVARYGYEPYGTPLLDDSTGRDVTPYQYTGQLRDEATDLYYYASRYYDPELARFTTADSILPGDGRDPRGLNRYAYAFNNPIKYRDPDGHCPTCRPIEYSWTERLDTWFTEHAEFTQALVDVSTGMGRALTFGLTDVANEAAGSYDVVRPDPESTASMVGEGAGTVVGFFVPIPGVGGGSGAARVATTTTVGTTVTAARLTATAARSGRSVWSMGRFARGRTIEALLNRAAGITRSVTSAGPRLVSNFPVIDRFIRGVATSVKSLDLMASSYASAAGITSRLRTYINTLSRFSGATRGGVTVGGSTAPITERVLELVIPPGATAAQMSAIQGMVRYGASLPNPVRVVIIEML